MIIIPIHAGCLAVLTVVAPIGGMLIPAYVQKGKNRTSESRPLGRVKKPFAAISFRCLDGIGHLSAVSLLCTCVLSSANGFSTVVLLRLREKKKDGLIRCTR